MGNMCGGGGGQRVDKEMVERDEYAYGFGVLLGYVVLDQEDRVVTQLGWKLNAWRKIVP
jgi:hypothetical protein